MPYSQVGLLNKRYAILTIVSSSAKKRGPYVGSMMRVTHQWVLDHVYARILAAGYKDIGRSHASIFRYPTPDGLRPSELAEQLQITKQSVNDVLRDMEAIGYLTRVHDPSDGRARVIRLTAKGRRLETIVYDGAQSAESAIANLLGPSEFIHLRNSLEKVVRGISDGSLSPHRVRGTGRVDLTAHK